MAFLFESDRGLCSYETAVLDQSHLGPGRYLTNQSRRQQKGYAPFLSTTSRSSDPSNGSQRRQLSSNPNISITASAGPIKPNSVVSTPGPGSYEVSRPIVKDNGLSINGIDKMSSMVVWKGNNTSAPAALSCSSNFKSGVNRFNKLTNEVPGPGSYELAIAAKTAKSTGEQQPPTEQNIILTEIRLHNMSRKIPSIPAQKNIDNTNEQPEIEEKQPVQNGRAVFNVENGIKVGPGEYELKGQFDNSKGDKNHSHVWSKSKVDRFSKEKEESKRVGPGLYYINREPMARYKKGLSASFRQPPRRTCFDDIEINNSSDNGYVFPEPATYNIDSQFVYKPPSIHSTFSVNQPRFKESDKGYNIDPGQYQAITDIETKELKPKRVNQQNEAFLQSSVRDDTFLMPFKSQKINPGVGIYNVNQINSIKNEVVRKYHVGYKGKFGSREERFKEDKPTESSAAGVGVGIGQSEDGEKELSKSQITPQTNQNGSFKSQTQREPYGNIQNNIPSCGEYNLDYDSIQYRANKQKLFIENLKKIDVQKPAFDQKKARFSHYENSSNPNSDANQIIEAAGENDWEDEITHKKCKETRAKSVSSTFTRGVTQPFLSKTKKIDYVPFDEEVPGPGGYDSKKAEWNKKSYNVKYRKNFSKKRV